MANFKTADEVRQECVLTLGTELGPLYADLENDLLWLHVRWREYRELYGTKPERIDLLNRAAPLLFGIVQTTLYLDVLLGLARLTDPSKSMGKDNLTVHRLASLIQDQGLRTEVEEAVAKAKDSCEFARDWRNRRIAHTDLALISQDQSAKPLAEASGQHVEEALARLRVVLNCMNKHYFRATTAHDMVHDRGDGAVSLLHYLARGLRAENDESLG